MYDVVLIVDFELTKHTLIIHSNFLFGAGKWYEKEKYINCIGAYHDINVRM